MKKTIQYDSNLGNAFRDTICQYWKEGSDIVTKHINTSLFPVQLGNIVRNELDGWFDVIDSFIVINYFLIDKPKLAVSHLAGLYQFAGLHTNKQALKQCLPFVIKFCSVLGQVIAPYDTGFQRDCQKELPLLLAKSINDCEATYVFWEKHQAVLPVISYLNSNFEQRKKLIRIAYHTIKQLMTLDDNLPIMLNELAMSFVDIRAIQALKAYYNPSDNVVINIAKLAKLNPIGPNLLAHKLVKLLLAGKYQHRHRS